MSAPRALSSAAQPSAHTARTVSTQASRVPAACGCAGTVLDHTATHPTENSFFLISHAGLKGTSRPTHYHVLFDTLGMPLDEFQQFTNKYGFLLSLCVAAFWCEGPCRHVPYAWQASAPGMCGWPCVVQAGALSRCCWCWEHACVVVTDSWPPQLQLAVCMGCQSRTAMPGGGKHLMTAVRVQPREWLPKAARSPTSPP